LRADQIESTPALILGSFVLGAVPNFLAGQFYRYLWQATALNFIICKATKIAF
jgi:hypothetical protein